MNRRQFLATATTAGIGTLAGCSSENKHPVQIQKQVTVPPEEYHAIHISVPKSGGIGYKLSYDIQTDGDFDIFLFPVDVVNPSFESYKKIVKDESEAKDSPDAIDRFSNAHVSGTAELSPSPINKGKYKLVIDNTEFKAKGGVYGHGPSDSPLEFDVTVDVVVNLPEWARSLS